MTLLYYVFWLQGRMCIRNRLMLRFLPVQILHFLTSSQSIIIWCKRSKTSNFGQFLFVHFRVVYWENFLSIGQQKGITWKDRIDIKFLSMRPCDRYLSQFGWSQSEIFFPYRRFMATPAFWAYSNNGVLLVFYAQRIGMRWFNVAVQGKHFGEESLVMSIVNFQKIRIILFENVLFPTADIEVPLQILMKCSSWRKWQPIAKNLMC